MQTTIKAPMTAEMIGRLNVNQPSLTSFRY
jgi:hypothetical protein